MKKLIWSVFAQIDLTEIELYYTNQGSPESGEKIVKGLIRRCKVVYRLVEKYCHMNEISFKN